MMLKPNNNNPRLQGAWPNPSSVESKFQLLQIYFRFQIAYDVPKLRNQEAVGGVIPPNRTETIVLLA